MSFLGHAREVVSRIDRSIAEAYSLGRGDLGSLAVGYLPGASPIVPRFIRAFRRRHAKVDVRLSMVMPPDPVNAVRNSQVDFLFIATPVSEPDLIVERLQEEPMILAIPGSHPLADQKSISFRSLDGVPVVMWPRHIGPASYDKLLDCFKNAGARLNTALETFPLNCMVCAVASGIGVSFVPQSARETPQRDVVYRDLRLPRPMVEWAIVYRSKSLGGASDAFLKVVRELCAMSSSRPRATSRRSGRRA
jgi:DNA-binding transcriptional LysR family regulator